MEYRNLEIKVTSAKDLKNVNLINKMDVYVVVSISGDPKTQQKTTVDRNGNTNPTWNFPMKFTVDESAARNNRLNVVFKLRCERNLGDKDIGEVNVPVKELIASIEDGKMQFVTYQVRKPSGRPKGELNFSYKWGEKIAGAVAPAPYANKKSDEPVTAYPAPVAGTSSAYPPPYMATATGTYPPPGPGGYPPPPPDVYPPAPVTGYGYPQPSYGGYPPPPGYGHQPQPGYGYQPQQGYGYPPVQQPAKKNKFGLGMGAGLLGGALGGLLIGDMISDGGGYDGGYDGGFDGGF